MASSVEAVQGADALAVVTEWNEFKNISLDMIYGALNEPVIFDGRICLI